VKDRDARGSFTQCGMLHLVLAGDAGNQRHAGGGAGSGHGRCGRCFREIDQDIAVGEERGEIAGDRNAQDRVLVAPAPAAGHGYGGVA
jgi:hypothetical protein